MKWWVPALLIFILIALSISTGSILFGPLDALDTALAKAVTPYQTQELGTIFEFITNFGGPILVGAFDCILLAYLLFTRRKKLAVLFASAVLVGGIASQFFKFIFARSRPEDIIYLISRHGFSFPSGHALASTIFYGFLGYVIGTHMHKQWHKVGVYILTGVLIFLIGFSRIFLGVHWFSDVVGGWSLGLGLLAFFIHMYKLTRR